MTDKAESKIAKLRTQVERALERSDASSSSLAISLLNRILEIAVDGSDDALFAHRQLAELLLEKQPWRAALHVRRVLVHDESDDALHAMMGLCQALLGNYRAAVAAYERATRIAPSVAWYHHNLGHLLDVALDDPKRAETSLRTAYRLASHHDEVVGSLAHCLARVDQRDEALDLAKRARRLKPNKPAHRELLEWIERGGRSPASESLSSGASRGGQQGTDARETEVADAFETQMRLRGYSTTVIDGAHKLWEDFARGRSLRSVKTAVYAASIEYAMAMLVSWPGVSQASVARRYGIAPGSVATRYAEIRDALGIRPFDPRYSSKS